MRNAWYKISTGWTLRRVIYMALGALMIGQSVAAKEWIGVVFGGYFAAMGLFAFGCAGGNCYVPQQQPQQKAENVEYEEVK